jgi:hypothetical protein
MRTLVAAFISLVIVQFIAFAAGWNMTVLSLAFLMAVGLMMAPYRVYQVASGGLAYAGPFVELLFLLTLLLWLGVLWGAYNVYMIHSCTGDNCLGYFLYGAPFPFVYALAEVLRLMAKSKA